MHSTIGLRLSLIPFLMISTVGPGIAEAQGVPFETRTVTLVESTTLPQGKRALVIRRASGDQRDVIALGSAATPEDLGSALRVLDALHDQFGETIGRDIAASVKSEAPSTSRSSSLAKLHAAFLQELRRSEAREVTGFGGVKALDIKVPKRIRRG